MDYDQAIKLTFPNIQANQYSLRDDGQGVFIESWTYPDAPQPLLSDLTDLAQKGELIAPLNKEMNMLIHEKLDKTDWYFSRKIDKGTDVPQDIIDLRNQARLRIDEIQAEIEAIMSA